MGRTASDKKKQEVPFYVSQYKTSAEIIEEAKANLQNLNMTKQGAFPAISDTRSAFRTVDTKRPFTPRQTDRRLYSGSTNHVARPPSSFRLLPLPEEDTWSRPGTGAGKQHSPTSAKLSPLSSQKSLEEPCFDNGKLPR